MTAPSLAHIFYNLISCFANGFGFLFIALTLFIYLFIFWFMVLVFSFMFFSFQTIFFRLPYHGDSRNHHGDLHRQSE